MTPGERFISTLNFKTPDDRMPMVEWAAWWDLTIDRWKKEGLPTELEHDEAQDYFYLDCMYCISAQAISPQCKSPEHYAAPIITDEASYEEIEKYLFTDSIIENLIKQALKLKERHDRGEIIIRLWLDGFFWLPRSLFGIEGHIYAFYDYPELMHRINARLADFNIRVIEELFKVLKPDMVGFAEDMSYNHGPMISYGLFKEFLLPYYQKVIPFIKKHNVKVFVDSDGDITSMIPWLLEAGIEGVYPLERQAGVDILKIREEYPEFLMLGGYDKMIMSLGEEEMRREFERILPVMRSGGYIPSVDHQTPPGVSFENYKIYMRLFKEYATKAILK
jgi:Uroporphyrinogen-III decarboxylase